MNNCNKKYSNILLHVFVKGVVQWDLRGVENRLKKSIMTSYIAFGLHFFMFKVHHHKKGKNHWTYRLNSGNPANNWLRTLNQDISPTAADDYTVWRLYRAVISRRKCLIISRYNQMYPSAAQTCTVCTVESQYSPNIIPYYHQPAHARFYVSNLSS
jgi:hypothetical protein